MKYLHVSRNPTRLREVRANDLR